MMTMIQRIHESTPHNRKRAIDGFRALATLCVPLGHWFIGGFYLSDSAVHISSPLGTMEYLAPASWVLQMLAVFFLVGGYSSALSYTRARERGDTYRDWMFQRITRLCLPMLGVGVVLALLTLAVLFADLPYETWRSATRLTLQPLWFIAVYIGATALTPVCIRAQQYAGWWSAVVIMAWVACIDALRYGPLAEHTPSWVAWSALLGWLFAYQLGVSWWCGAVTRHRARVLLIGGVLLFIALLLWFEYPASLVGVPGEERTNAHPPSLLVLALGAIQVGAVVLLYDRVTRVLQRPAVWAGAVIINVWALTILCWHQVAMLSVTLSSSLFGEVAGLTSRPDSLNWVTQRAAWIPVFTVVLVILGVGAQRCEKALTQYVLSRRDRGEHSQREGSTGAETRTRVSGGTTP